jgi:hypothetical protein
VDPKQLHFSRRKFMQGAAMIGAVPLMPNHGFSTSDSDKAPPQSAEGTVPKKSLGRTGVQVSALGLGGYHLGSIRLQTRSWRRRSIMVWIFSTTPGNTTTA